jgi:hypothetical protein
MVFDGEYEVFLAQDRQGTDNILTIVRSPDEL